MMIPSSLLLSYFDKTQSRLQQLKGGDELCDADPELPWHRSRIVEAQLTSLGDAISEWRRQNNNNGDPSIISDTMQSVLRQIGLGDFSCVSFDGSNQDFTLASTPTTGLRSRSSRGSGDENGTRQSEKGVLKDHIEEQQQLLTEAVETTNEMARLAFARSVLTIQWRLDRQQPPQSKKESREENDNIDEESTLEYCGLMMAAVRLPEIQKYLQNGTIDSIHPDQTTENPSEDDWLDSSVEERLIHIQKLYWRALGWEPIHAIDQLTRLLSGGSNDSNNFQQIRNNAKGMETLTKYASAMTVAVTNAAMSKIGDNGNQCNDDGTTRVVSVSYSEKIINVQTDSENATSHSISAPTSNTIDEHKISQQRQELDVAHKASMLQQQLWSEFQSLPSHEKSTTLGKAKKTHHEFLEKVANTPPGRDRVLLMQSMDGEMQKLLVIYKLWCSQTSGEE